MKRLTIDKDVSEMSMYELAHNSCYAKNGKARVRDFENDFDTRELAIKLLEKYADIPNEFTCDDDFDEFMLDSLQYGTDSILGLIAVFYRNLWAMADLRERLKGYEDIGLVPEQLREIDRLYAEKCKELADSQRSSFSGLELVKIWAKLKKLKEYQNLEKQGKLLKLPCEIGHRVYMIYQFCGEGAWEIEEHKIRLEDLENIGKTVFLTIEEAEAALKEL